MGQGGQGLKAVSSQPSKTGDRIFITKVLVYSIKQFSIEIIDIILKLH